MVRGSALAGEREPSASVPNFFEFLKTSTRSSRRLTTLLAVVTFAVSAIIHQIERI
jgi:hypothetical protein